MNIRDLPAATPPAEARPSVRRDTGRLYRIEIRNEFLKQMRLPIFAVSTIVFPVMFYLIFGLTFGQQPAGPVDVATYMLATYGAFGVIGSALFGFGVGVAAERGQGWMILKRASPMPPLAYFVSKIVMAALFGGITAVALFATGMLIADITLGALTWLALLGVLVAGVIPFCAMGMALGYAVGPNSAPVLVNVVYLPMAFLSGLWMPLEILPDVVQGIAPYLPAFHLGQLALDTLGAGLGGPAWHHVLVLTAFSAAFLLAAVLLYRRDEGRTFG